MNQPRQGLSLIHIYLRYIVRYDLEGLTKEEYDKAKTIVLSEPNACLLYTSFRIGEKKLRKLAEENIDAGWVIVNGNRIQIKRKQFEKIIDTLDEI